MALRRLSAWVVLDRCSVPGAFGNRTCITDRLLHKVAFNVCNDCNANPPPFSFVETFKLTHRTYEVPSSFQDFVLSALRIDQRHKGLYEYPALGNGHWRFVCEDH